MRISDVHVSDCELRNPRSTKLFVLASLFRMSAAGCAVGGSLASSIQHLVFST